MDVGCTFADSKSCLLKDENFARRRSGYGPWHRCLSTVARLTPNGISNFSAQCCPDIKAGVNGQEKIHEVSFPMSLFINEYLKR